MNVNNPRIDKRNGYYNYRLWMGGPYLVVFNPKNKNEFAIDFNKLSEFNINTPYSEIIKNNPNQYYSMYNFKKFEFLGKSHIFI